MFTGIVTDVGEIEVLKPVAQGQLHRLRILCRYDQTTIADGASIACNGVCLTVVGSGVAGERTWFEVDAAAETLGMTTAKHWRQGTPLNLERALKIGDELGGHIVAGHADGIATILSRERSARHGAVRAARAARPCEVHRAEGLDHARRRVADGQYGRSRPLYRADHSAHARR